MEDFGVELVDERLELVDGVEHLHAAGVGVEAHLEGPRHVRHPTPELVLGVLEALGDVVDRLVLLVLVGLDGRRGGLEGPQLGLVAERVQKLAVRAEEARAVRLHVALFLAKAELHGEPVYLPKNA